MQYIYFSFPHLSPITRAFSFSSLHLSLLLKYYIGVDEKKITSKKIEKVLGSPSCKEFPNILFPLLKKYFATNTVSILNKVRVLNHFSIFELKHESALIHTQTSNTSFSIAQNSKFHSSKSKNLASTWNHKFEISTTNHQKPKKKKRDVHRNISMAIPPTLPISSTPQPRRISYPVIKP